MDRITRCDRRERTEVCAIAFLIVIAHASLLFLAQVMAVVTCASPANINIYMVFCTNTFHLFTYILE